MTAEQNRPETRASLPATPPGRGAAPHARLSAAARPCDHGSDDAQRHPRGVERERSIVASSDVTRSFDIGGVGLQGVDPSHPGEAQRLPIEFVDKVAGGLGD